MQLNNVFLGHKMGDWTLVFLIGFKTVEGTSIDIVTLETVAFDEGGILWIFFFEFTHDCLFEHSEVVERFRLVEDKLYFLLVQ